MSVFHRGRKSELINNRQGKEGNRGLQEDPLFIPWTAVLYFAVPTGMWQGTINVSEVNEWIHNLSVRVGCGFL